LKIDEIRHDFKGKEYFWRIIDGLKVAIWEIMKCRCINLNSTSENISDTR